MSNNQPPYDLQPSDGHGITIRLARSDDVRSLWRLAHLDSSPLPPAPFLLAEVDGRLLAAISLASGETIADPFSRTAEFRPLLELRAAQLRRGDGGNPARPRPLSLLAPRRLLRATASRAAAG